MDENSTPTGEDLPREILDALKNSYEHVRLAAKEADGAYTERKRRAVPLRSTDIRELNGSTSGVASRLVREGRGGGPVPRSRRNEPLPTPTQRWRFKEADRVAARRHADWQSALNRHVCILVELVPPQRGADAQVARALGVRPSTVTRWRQRAARLATSSRDEFAPAA